jgi:hypothetical protein
VGTSAKVEAVKDQEQVVQRAATFGWRPKSAYPDPCPASFQGDFSEWIRQAKTPGSCPTCGARVLLVVTTIKEEAVWTAPHNRQADRVEELLGGRLSELETAIRNVERPPSSGR